jgi:ribonuclease HI
MSVKRMNNRQIIIYTDGSSLGNPGKGGWAAILSAVGKTLELSGGYRMTTNNRMELMAVIKALSALKEECNNVTIFTDSQLIVNSINKSWIDNWIKKDWKKSDKKPVLNVDLWKKLIPLLKKHNVRFIWIEGHKGIGGNERCDILCKQAAAIAVEVDFEYENNLRKIL